MNELYKHPYLISQSNTCMFLVISHRRKFYWLRRKIWAQNFNETMFTIFLQNKLGLMNRMIELPARPHLVYTWAVSDVSIVICHTSGSQGEDWMNWTPNILSNRNYYYPRALRISLPLWHLIKWDIGLMSFTPGH